MNILNKLVEPITLALNNAANVRTAYRENSHREHTEIFHTLVTKLDALAEGQKVLSDMISKPKRKL